MGLLDRDYYVDESLKRMGIGARRKQDSSRSAADQVERELHRAASASAPAASRSRQPEEPNFIMGSRHPVYRQARATDAHRWTVLFAVIVTLILVGFGAFMLIIKLLR